jgi:invasion protein IalB
MRLYHWVAIGAAGALLTASAAAVVLGSQKSTGSNDTSAAAGRNDRNPPLVRESQVRQAPAAQAPAGSPSTSSPSRRVESTTYDSWVVVCQDAVGGTTKKTCAATLKVVGPDKRQALLSWRIGLNKDGHFVTAFYIPPAMATKKGDRTVGGPLLIQNGVELKFGNGPARRINYVWCGPQQCFAEALIDDAFIKDALASTQATVTINTEGGGPIPLDFSVKGIDKAISSTRK